MPLEICVRSPLGNQAVLASLVTSRKDFFDFLLCANVPWALKKSVVGAAAGGILIADIAEHIGVGVGVGVLLAVEVGVGVVPAGVPVQMARLTSDAGDAATVLVPPPPPPQLQINAKATNDTTGTTTRHLRHQSIAP